MALLLRPGVNGADLRQIQSAADLLQPLQPLLQLLLQPLLQLLLQLLLRPLTGRSLDLFIRFYRRPPNSCNVM